MKVLVSPAQTFLDPSYGSEVSWAYNVVARLAERFGVRLDVVCGKADGLVMPNRVRIFNVGFERRDLMSRALFYFRCYGVAKKLCGNADVVHHMFPFGFRAGFNPLAIFGHLRDKPFVIGPIQYPQEYSDITDYEWVSGMGGLKAQLMYNLEHTTMRFIQKPIEMLNEATLSEAEVLVFDSRKTLELYRRLYLDILRDKTLEVIPPGVEIEQFKYVPPIKKDYFEIMTAGYLLRRKGIQYLIEAMSLIVREFKGVRLRIVGDGPFKGELVRLVRKLSLDDKVRFEGLVPRDELVKYYVNCDVYVQPSLSETFPSTIREAMSVGRPVIATKVGFIEEHIMDNDNGFLVPKRNVEEIAKKVLLLLSDENLRLRMGAKARDYAERNFDWNKIATMWYNTYSKLTVNKVLR
jgi:glycosyltransferase involved in cell wall biosynthesis